MAGEVNRSPQGNSVVSLCLVPFSVTLAAERRLCSPCRPEMCFLPGGMQLDHKRPLHTAPAVYVGPGESHVMSNPSAGTAMGSGHMERSAIPIDAEALCLVHVAVTLTVSSLGSLTSLGLDVLEK